MEITRKTDYAIRMMMHLAIEDAGQPVSVRRLAELGDVPYSFARAVQRDLSSARLVTTTRGAKGGMRLARPAEEITLLDVITSMQGAPSLSMCATDPEWCHRSPGCTVHPVWVNANTYLRTYLGDITLASLIVDGDNC